MTNASQGARSNYNPIDFVLDQVKRSVDYVYDDVVAARLW